MRVAPHQRWWPVLLLATACFQAPSTYPRLYHSEAHAPSVSATDIQALNTLGATVIDQGVNFSVYSEHATRIDLLIFENPETDLPTREFEMTPYGNVWNTYVEGVGERTYYGFIAWGPNWPYDPKWQPGAIDGFIADVDGNGNRFNPNKLLIDPYATQIHRDHDWSRGSLASGPSRAVSTLGAASKSIVTVSHYQWSPGEATWQSNRQAADFPGHNWNDLIVYETHVKGFTMDPASAVQHPGTYRGLAEKADYFADLGVTAVELIPVMSKPSDGGYWGYMTVNFFGPELTYAAAAYPWEVVDEFKAMVDALHQRNIEVILDVVYNHFGEGGLWRDTILYGGSNGGNGGNTSFVDPEEVASLYNFRGLDNAAYYALSADNLQYWNNTGVGQESRPNHTPMHRLIMDSLHFWSQQMHVDGFRFDLAPVLGEKDGDYNNWDATSNTVLQTIIDDPVLQQSHTRIIAESWEAGGNDPYKVGQFPAATHDPGVGWYEWNGRYRDWWRNFENNGSWVLNSFDGDGQGRVVDGGGTLTGSSALYKWNRRPYHAVNFVTIHDGFTMYDLFSYNTKVNACGPLNTICCDSPNSPFCDPNSGTTDNRSFAYGSDAAGEALKRQHMRNLFTAMMVSHGTPLILGGDEWMRTQLGNNNAYSTWADNAFNWYSWGEWQPNDEKNRMHDFVRSLLKFRKTHAYAFAPSDWVTGAPFSWKSPTNTDTPDWTSKTLMIHYYDSTKGAQLAILINGSASSVNFTLPAGPSWRRMIDTQSYFDSPAYLQTASANFRTSANIDLVTPLIVSGSYGVFAHSMVVLEDGGGPKKQ